MSTAAILLAAGAGTRTEAPIPKAFLPLGGRPMVVHSIDALLASDVVDHLVLVVPRSEIGRAERLFDGMPHPTPIHAIVGGGPTRQASVTCGLQAVAEEADVILCHDAARPFATSDLFRRVVAALGEHEAHGVVPIVPTPDTVKRVTGGVIVETIARAETALAQTPQGFIANALLEAHAEAAARGESDATDDAMLLESAGFRVVTVRGEPGNFKITTAEDYRRAERLMAERSSGRAVG